MATQYWLGAAVKTPGVKHFALTGAWATDDTLYFEINGKRLTLTVGSTATIDQIIADAVDMINGASANDDETRSALGSNVGEFAILSASADTTNDHVILTGPSDGRPIGAVTVGETTTGDGAIAAATATDVTDTGPHHFTDADNWSSGSVPSNGDDIVFDSQAAAACKYDLSNGSLTPTSVAVTNGFRHSIGLSAVNKDNPSTPFDEPEETYLTFAGGGTVSIDGSGSGMIKIDTGTGASYVNVTGSGTTTERGNPPVMVKAAHASSTLSVSSGTVGLCVEPLSTGQVATAYVGGGSSPQLEIGSGVTIATLNTHSGSSVCSSAITTLQCTGGTHVQKAGAITTANVSGGKLQQLGTGTITTLVLSKGSLDCSEDVRARAITNCTVYGGSTIKDPTGSISFGANGIDLYAKPQDVVLDLIPNRNYVISTI